MRLIFLSVFTIVLLTGCVSKKVLIQEDLINEQALINSQSVQVKDGIKPVVFIVATYLNDIKSKYVKKDNYDKFLVGLYTPQKSALISEVEFVINDDANNTIVQAVPSDDALLKLIPTYNSWSNYYLVKIQNQETRTLKLEFVTKEYPKTGIIHQKIKYTVSPEFKKMQNKK